MTPGEAFELHAKELQERMQKRSRGRRTLLLLGAPFVAIMLFIVAVNSGDEDAHRSVTDAAELWASNDVADYRVTYLMTVGDETFGPATAVVADGELAAYLTDDPTLEDSRVLTVESAFFAIEDVATGGGSVTAEYHPDLGYTVNASLDPDLDVPGDEWSFEVTDFQPTSND